MADTQGLQLVISLLEVIINILEPRDTHRRMYFLLWKKKAIVIFPVLTLPKTRVFTCQLLV